MSSPLFKTLFSTLLLASLTSPAAILVDLDPGLARFDSTTDNDDLGAGFGAGDPGADAENANGLTFNVTFSPAAGDLDSGTAAVSLLEIGGDANGSGLYLLGGELHFISKMNGGVSDVPSFNDLDWSSGNSMIGVRSSYGPLSAGLEYSVAVVFDPITSGTLEIGVMAPGDTVSKELYSLQNRNGKNNWSGDDSASAFRGGNIGNFGAANTVGGNPFQEAAMNGNPFEGGQGQALYWSLNGTIIPEPSAALLAGAGLLLLLGSRRRR